MPARSLATARTASIINSRYDIDLSCSQQVWCVHERSMCSAMETDVHLRKNWVYKVGLVT